MPVIGMQSGSHHGGLGSPLFADIVQAIATGGAKAIAVDLLTDLWAFPTTLAWLSGSAWRSRDQFGSGGGPEASEIAIGSSCLKMDMLAYEW